MCCMKLYIFGCGYFNLGLIGIGVGLIVVYVEEMEREYEDECL